MSFKLDPRLEADTLHLGDFDLCRVLLMNDSQYPWVILVPRKEGVTEIFELSFEEQQQLMLESNFLLEEMAKVFDADKMNVANLGNMVSQLHIHHVARFKTDPAWPDPVWGAQPAKAYSESELEDIFEKVRSMLEAS